MTFAPDNLRAVRALLLDHLDIHENSGAYPTDLDPAEVGIVGDPAHIGGYHCGSDRVKRDSSGRITDYSVRESSRDRDGLTEAASALDIGQWSATVAGKRHDLRSMSVWLVAQCKAGVPDTRDIREVIYSPDGTTVRRWDRLGIRTSGDSSHRWHTHISYHRDATRAGRDQTGLWRRYLSEIGLMAGEDDDMDATQAQQLREVHWSVGRGVPRLDRPGEMEAITWAWDRVVAILQEIAARVDIGPEELTTIAAAVPQPDEQAIADGVLSGLGVREPEQVARALVAAGMDPAQLAAALTALAAPAG